MNAFLDFLTDRLHVLGNRSSVVRVLCWIVAGVLLLGHFGHPPKPTVAERGIPADNPPAPAVDYVAPLVMSDNNGFLVPPHDPSKFTIAWVGSSEVKLGAVSVPGDFSLRVSQIDGRPIHIDVYSLVANRPLDAYISLRAALASGADAIVLSVNPVWFRPEWSIKDWPNLDVSDPGALFHDSRTIAYGLGSVSPSDITWSTLRSLLPRVRAQDKENARLQHYIDKLAVLAKPANLPAPTVPKAFRPFETDFWLAQYIGRDLPTDSVTRLGLLMKGMGIGDEAAGREYVSLIVGTIADSHKPAFVYNSALSFATLADATMGTIATKIESDLADIGTKAGGTNLVVQSKEMTREMKPADLFIDVVHQKDAGPFSDLLVGKICGGWSAIATPVRCTTTASEVGR